MPFIVTCDHCRAKLRTAARLADGRSVDCAKCGAAFVIRADNQRDEAAPAAGPGWEVVEDEPAPAAKPPARRRAAAEVAEDDDRPRKKARPAGNEDEENDRPRKKAAARRDEDDEDRPRRSRRARDDEDDEDDEDDRPRKRAGRGRVYWWVGGGLAAALLVGAGLFFLLRKPSGPDAEVEQALATRPKRELPKDLFAYWPGEQHTLEYADLTAPGASPFVGDGAKALGLTPDQVGRRLYCSARAASGEKVEVYGLKAAFDLPAAARANGFEAVKVAGGTVFRTSRVQVFQPSPTVVVACDQGFAGFDVKDPPTQKTEELMRRGPGDTKVPDGLWELLQEVSGFPAFSGSIPRAGDDLLPVKARFHVSGSGRTADGAESESLTCDAYASPEEAKRAEAARRQLEERLAEKFPNQKDRRKDARTWVQDNRVYTYRKTPVTPAPPGPKLPDPPPPGLSAADHAKKLKDLGLPAPRDVKALLTYLPSQTVSLTYTDCAAQRAAGKDHVYLPDAFVLGQLGLDGNAVERWAQLSESTTAGNYHTVVTYLLGADRSLDKTAKADGKGVRKQVVDGKTTYLATFSSKPVVLFQPDPRTVVSVSRNLGPASPDPALVARVLALTPETAKPPDGLAEALRDVSGFPTVSIFPREMHGLTGAARARYHATATNPDPKRKETCQVEPFPTAAAAAAAAADRQKSETPKPDTVRAAWAHGNTLYAYARTTTP